MEEICYVSPHCFEQVVLFFYLHWGVVLGLFYLMHAWIWHFMIVIMLRRIFIMFCQWGLFSRYLRGSIIGSRCFMDIVFIVVEVRLIFL